jgi:hypothetical protein
MARTTCALTGKPGKFVRCHIVPRAFTDRNLDQTPRIEFGENRERPGLRYTSWYDDNLVTEEGEKRLAELDNLAVIQLKKFGLCWRFFPISPLVQRDRIGDTEFELLLVQGADTKGLRVFLLSLLWRAVMTSRPEFREIRVDFESRQKLRKIVRGEVTPNPADFPTTVLLLTTKGRPHNHTPLRDRMLVPQLTAGSRKEIKMVRFFLDGLIVHMGRRKMDERLLEAWGKRAVGVNDDLILIGRPYEGSFQQANLIALEDELDAKWPEESTRIYSILSRGARE